MKTYIDKKEYNKKYVSTNKTNGIVKIRIFIKEIPDIFIDDETNI